MSASTLLERELLPVDSTLADWSAYFQLLLSGQLEDYRGKFVVIYEGEIVAEGEDPMHLRRQMSQRLGIAGEQLVIPFVDQRECVIS